MALMQHNVLYMLSFNLQDSLVAEEQQPMLPLLQPYLESHDLIVASGAVTQFEKLLGEFGGEHEQTRWQDLHSRVTIVYEESSQTSQEDDVLHTYKASLHSQQSHDSNSINALHGRVTKLQAISAAQRQVFALGDDQHATTLTANAKAYDFAARQGVKLQVFIHRAVWLTGL